MSTQPCLGCVSPSATAVSASCSIVAEPADVTAESLKLQTEFAWKVCTDLMDNVKFADAKGGIMFTIITALTGTVIGVLGTRITDNPKIVSAPVYGKILLALLIAYLPLAVAGLYSAFSVVRPRGYSSELVYRKWKSGSHLKFAEPKMCKRRTQEDERRDEGRTGDHRGLVGSVQIIELEGRDAYAGRLTCPRARLQDVVSRIGMLAWIDYQKYRYVHRAVTLSFWTFICGVALISATILASVMVPK